MGGRSTPLYMYPATQIGHDCSVAQPVYRKSFFWAPVLLVKSSRPSAAHTNAGRCKVDLGFADLVVLEAEKGKESRKG